MKKKSITFLLLFAAFFCVSAQNAQLPNIIYILADDLGFGDLSCYGQTNFQTPNIDKLAAKGIKFTQHYSGSPICAPSRSTLMTGLHTGHTPIRGNKEMDDGQAPLPSQSITIAEVLKEAGYATGAFGKWGLGFIGSEGDPNLQGFDMFFGYNCQRRAHRYYPDYLWENSKQVLMEGNDWTNMQTYAPDIIQQKALEFIQTNINTPFFAYIPLIQPHAELIVPIDSLFEKFSGSFIEPPEVYLPNASDYGPHLVIPQYAHQPQPKAVYAAMVSRIDVYVGQIMDKLEELGIEGNTILIFTSDNGPSLAGGSNPAHFNSSGSLRGAKRDLFEGGIRVPLIVSWPAVIEPGTSSDHVSAFWDVMPTFAEIVGVSPPSGIDGISFLPTLTGVGVQQSHPHLYWEYNYLGGRQAVRNENWKAVLYDTKRNKSSKLELYNLDIDPFETTNVAANHPDMFEKMMSLFLVSHVHSDLFPLPLKK